MKKIYIFDCKTWEEFLWVLEENEVSCFLTGNMMTHFNELFLKKIDLYITLLKEFIKYNSERVQSDVWSFWGLDFLQKEYW